MTSEEDQSVYPLQKEMKRNKARYVLPKRDPPNHYFDMSE